MDSDANVDVLAGVKAHIQALEASNAALREQLHVAHLNLNAAKEQSTATLVPGWIERIEKCCNKGLMRSVTSGIVFLEILEGLDKTACAGFVVLSDAEESKTTLKIRFSMVKEPAVFIERIVKVKYFTHLVNLQPEDIFVLQGGWNINGVHDLTVWTYEEYQKRNDRPGPPLVINRRPVKKSKIDQEVVL